MQQQKTEQLQKSVREEFTVSRMIGIPAGSFLMGSDAGQDNERPVHRVWVDPFELGACQVTNAEYGQFFSATGHRKPLHWDGPNFSDPLQPVVAPSWFDAVEYCEWLSRMTQRKFRLPTEAEWEYAARGGQEQKLFPWGDERPESLANYGTRWKTGPEPVGCAEANGYGLCDIGANVHEWCADWFDADYYRVSPERNPQGPAGPALRAPSGAKRAAPARRASRGGSWRHFTKVSRCAARSSIPPEFQYADYGFRVACDVRE
ncbi:MAG TPA: SUMF1/EgtB/PvdO family nonheme iron enzyme [Candidatus Binatus sp.]|jgi:sulfatase modifying factor 1|nr:SUMF1/EgtB/PvdO family nonheme iron enzyme [Candidatus Binatus sp.]